MSPRGAGRDLNAPGMGESRRAILSLLKEGGAATVPALAERVGLNIETVRAHLKVLRGQGLVEREGTRSHGPGRPEVIYDITTAAEALFPRREAQVLKELAAFLKETGRASALDEFFDRYIDERRAESLARVAGLEGRARLREAARILSEQGFMAVVEETDDQPRLRLCHCPLRELVEVSKVPCRAEVGFVRELIGERLTRVSYIPAGDPACSYAQGEDTC
ncbi:MAG: helix-turn-helix domain-containing protein [Gemmatimonadota bacterium]